MANPITNIRKEMQSIVSGLTTPDYQADWQSVKVWDESKQDLPAIYIIFPTEDNQDDNADTKTMSNVINATIQIFDSLSAESEFPREDHQDLMFDRLVDLKRAFSQELNATINDTCDHIQYESYEMDFPGSNDCLQASRLITNWTIQYGQYKLEPKNRK